jgi:hypothetical protein
MNSWIKAWICSSSRDRVSYRAVQGPFDLDDATLEDVKTELLYAHPNLVTDEGCGLVWTGAAGPTHMPRPALSRPCRQPSRWCRAGCGSRTEPI